ncbi:MAG: NADH-quinone oxidoreductase subunit NuoE [Alphaproteobacteria bacterium]
MSADAAFVQPETFSFTADNRAKAAAIIAKYPPGRQASAVLPLLDLAQRQHGNWLPRAAMDYVAGMLGMAPIRVYEVATFYTMCNLKPVGRWFFQICGTTPCWLRGADAVIATCEKELGIALGESTADGQFTLREVECLGACVNAPVIQVNDDFYEDLDVERTRALIEACRRGAPPKVGSQTGRQNSAPLGGPTTLKDAPRAGAED